VARVLLSGALRRHAGGVAELSIEAPSYRELLAALESRFPGMAPLIEGRTSLAIDGEIIPDPLLEPISEDSEIHFVPRVAGG
jgi:molybdopterin converting factor small subunit